MEKKEIIKEKIRQFQKDMPIHVFGRNCHLPLNSNKIITTIGVRRSGKTSILYDTVNQLLKQKVSPEKILFFNFDDERIHLDRHDLDLVLQAYREMYPDIKMENVFIFFDEIQMCNDWEQFVRRVYDSETKNIFISGSNSKLLATDIATSLRGRTMPFEVFPLSFQEFCNIKKINIDINYAPSKAKLIFSFNEFLYKGGFPEIVLSPNLNNIEILQEYYYVMLYKDLIERYRISNIPALKYFIRRVLANLCKPTSINKIYNEIKSAGITVSKNSLYEFIEYTESIFMFFKLLRFDKSFVKETLTDKKYYFIDNGLYSALHANNSENKGQLFENSIFLWLRTKKYFQRGLHFYKGIKECDFILIDRQKPEEIIQVCFDVSEPETLKREIAGLMEASDYLNCNNLKIITFNSEEEIKIDKKIVKIVPAWKEMLS